MNFAKFTIAYPALGKLLEFCSSTELQLPNFFGGDCTLYAILNVQAGRLSDDEKVQMAEVNSPHTLAIIRQREVYLLDDWLTAIL